MMHFPIGVLTNCLAVLGGGVIGSLLKKVVSDELKANLTPLFGLCAIGIGINSVIKANSMTPVILATLVGYIIGALLHLEQQTSRFFGWLVRVLHLGGQDIDMNFYVTAVALFCCSGFGWFATLTEGITGDPGLLFSKSVLDFFTATVFATAIGFALCAIPLVQFVMLFAVFAAGFVLAPMLTPTMFADLSACGGVLTLAAGSRVAKIRNFPVVDMMPALILIMPMSWLWTAIMG